MWTEITKNKADKLFSNGEDVYLLPSKVRPGGMWIQPYRVTKDEHTPYLDDVTNAFRYYNCNSELGRTVKYYIAV